MRFSCPACGKAYRLPPERLGPQGKAQIACPNCKALVAVAAAEGDELQCTLIRAADRPPSGAVASGSADAGAATPTAAGGWFVVLGKERQGPFTREQIAELANAGKLTQASMAWQKGLAAWTKIGDLPELAAVVPAARASQLTAAAPVEAKPTPDAARSTAPQSSPAAEAPAPSPAPQAATPAASAGKAAAPAPAKVDPPAAKPAKADGASPAKPEPAAAAKPGTPGGPVLDLFGDAKGGPGHHDSFFSSHQEIHLPDPHAHKPTKEEYQNLIQEFSVMFRLDKRTKRQKVLIGVVLGSLVVAAIAFGVVLKIGADRKRQLLTDSKQMLAAFSLSFATTVNVDVANADGENTPAEAKKPAVRKDVSAFSQEIAKKIRKKRSPSVAKASGNGNGGGGQVGRIEDAAKTAAADAAFIKKQQEEAMAKLAGPGGKTENLGLGVPGAQNFDFKSELRNVCRNRQGDMRACGKNAGQESGFTVTLTFNELGGVGKATVSGADASIGPCIASKLRGVKIGAQASGKSGDCKVD